MNRKNKTIVASLATLFFVFAFGIVSSGEGFLVRAEETLSYHCGRITFGNQLNYSTGTKLVYTSQNVSVASLSVIEGSVTQSSTASSPIKLGTTNSSGTLQIAFSSPAVVSEVLLFATGLATTDLATTRISLCSEASPAAQSQRLTTSSVPPALNQYLEDGKTVYRFKNLDGGTLSPSKWLAVGNQGGAHINMLYLCQITIRFADVTPVSSASSSESIVSSLSPIAFHFIDLQSFHSGDCIYIKAGNNDILIDAGCTASSATRIESYLEDSSRLNDHVSDGKLEYVIATHAHEDHIAGFSGLVSSTENGGRTGILYHYAVDHLLDFSYYDNGSLRIANSVTTVDSDTTQTYQNYVTARNYACDQGTSWQTAGEMWASGNTSVSLGEGLSMTLLYNYFYDHTSADASALGGSGSFSSQNDCSVCLLFKQGDRSFLFTGDAEALAEYSLTKYNALPHVDLFKAGHHGSYTASTASLLSAIQPSAVAVMCTAGNTEYTSTSANTFPSQAALNRLAPFTDRVYVTQVGSMSDSSYFAPLNGSIVFSYDTSGKETLSCSQNNTKLKDTPWFLANRDMPSDWAN